MPIMLIEESISYRFPDTPEQLREAQNHRNATLAGQQENRRGPLGVRKPLSDFTVAEDLQAARQPGV
jgi:hypothetical protein